MSVGVEPAVRARLVDAVVSQGFARAAILVREEAGPFGTHVVTATAQDAYPGTGRRVAVVDADGVAYGAALELGVADLARKLGWLTAPPLAEDAMRVVALAAFDGPIALTGAPPELARAADGGLELRFVREAFPSGAHEPMVVRIPPAGPAEVRRGAVGASAEPIPIDAATGLLRALATDDAMAILATLGKVQAPHDERARAALACAAMAPNEAIATTALMSLGGGAEALTALRTALTVAPGRRAQVAAWVAELFGSDLAAEL